MNSCLQFISKSVTGPVPLGPFIVITRLRFDDQRVEVRLPEAHVSIAARAGA